MNSNTKTRSNATKIDRSQNARIRAITETTMIVGIDIGSEKHDAGGNFNLAYDNELRFLP